MPPKGKKGQDKGKGGEEEREDPLQAVVCPMAHTYNYNANNLDSCGPLRDTLQPVHTRTTQGQTSQCILNVLY